MQSASFRLSAIKVPLIEKANGSLKTDDLMSSISCPGVNPISNILLEDGWDESIFLIITFSPNFNCEADFIFTLLYYSDLIYINIVTISQSVKFYIHHFLKHQPIFLPSYWRNQLRNICSTSQIESLMRRKASAMHKSYDNSGFLIFFNRFLSEESFWVLDLLRYEWF
jgi:hypothetical protein